MLERDYFIRIIREFGRALQTWLEKKEDPKGDEMLRSLYERYLGPAELLRNMTAKEALVYSSDNWPEERRIRMLGMLADLWYYEGQLKQNPLRDILLDKAFTLYDYIDSRSEEYSLLRKEKMKHILSLKNTQ